MSILIVLIICSVAVAAVFLTAFVFSARTGQFDDTDSPAQRILYEERSEKPSGTAGTSRPKNQVTE